MSATVDRDAMETADFPGPASVESLGPDDRRGALALRLDATRLVEEVRAENPRELANGNLTSIELRRDTGTMLLGHICWHREIEATLMSGFNDRASQDVR